MRLIAPHMQVQNKAYPGGGVTSNATLERGASGHHMEKDQAANGSVINPSIRYPCYS